MRLTGIVTDPERHLAIFAIPDGEPLARAEDKLIDAWRVERIAPNRVSLSGATRITILEPKSDPMQARPKPVTPAAAIALQAPVPGARTPPRPRPQQPGVAAFPPGRALIPPARAAPRRNSPRSQ